MGITAHLVDCAHGISAAGVMARLERQVHDGWAEVAVGSTGNQGYLTDWPSGPATCAGIYRLTFDTSAYFAALGTVSSYHEAAVTFAVSDPAIDMEITVVTTPHGFVAYVERRSRRD